MNKEPKYCGWSYYICGCYICSITNTKCLLMDKCPAVRGGKDKNDRSDIQ